MKPRTIVLALVVAGFLVVGCDGRYGRLTGSGILVERELAYTDFESIWIALGGNLTIVPSTGYGITLRADDNLIDLVTVYPDDGGRTLVFALDRNYYYRQASIDIEVRMPVLRSLSSSIRYYPYPYYDDGPQVLVNAGFADLDAVTISARDGSLEIESLDCARFELDCRIDDAVGVVSCDEADMDLTGDGLRLSGSATSLSLSASSAHNIDLSELVVSVAEVDIANGSTVEVNVSDTLSGTVDAESELTYSELHTPDIADLQIEAEPVDEGVGTE